MKSEYEEIGKRIKQARMSAGLSQKELIKKLGRSPSLISSWENGLMKPELVDAFRLEAILEVKDERISQLIIAVDYMEATGFSKTFPKHGGGTESVGASSVQSGKVIEIGEIGGKKVKLRLELE